MFQDIAILSKQIKLHIQLLKLKQLAQFGFTFSKKKYASPFWKQIQQTLQQVTHSIEKNSNIQSLSVDLLDDGALIVFERLC